MLYSIFMAAFSAGFITVLFATPLLANAFSIAVITPTPPVFANLNGDRLETFEAGQQVIITSTFTNTEDNQRAFVALFEVRNSNDVTVYLAWQSGVLAPQASSTIGVSWQTEDHSDHNARTFAITGFDPPQILSPVLESTIEAKSET